MADTIELKPCPFCGSKIVMAFARTCNKDSKYNPADRAFPIVRCRECGACSEGRDWSEPITAITKWNERATAATPLPADAALIGKLRHQLAQATDEAARLRALSQPEVAQVPAFPPWISVDDRLPEHGQNVAFVVRSNPGTYDDGRVLGGKYFKRDVEGFSEFSVPGQGYFAWYWLPLPDAPAILSAAPSAKGGEG